MKAAKLRSPMKTKTGKIRLGPLNINQLEKLLESTSKKKEKARIRSRILIMTQRNAKQ